MPLHAASTTIPAKTPTTRSTSVGKTYPERAERLGRVMHHVVQSGDGVRDDTATHQEHRDRARHREPLHQPRRRREDPLRQSAL